MRADRLLGMMLLLQTHGKMTASALAEKLEVSRRTILRDINALSTAGVPIYASGGHGGGIALDEQYHSTLAGMKEAEIRTLFLNDVQPILTELGLGDAGASSLAKLRAILPERHLTAVDAMRQRILIDPTWWWHEQDASAWWDALQRAVYEDYLIDVDYERYDGQMVRRVLEPYSLVAKSSVWYLVAVHAGARRTYRVQRLRRVEVLEQHFVREADFDLPTYWRTHMTTFRDEISAAFICTLRVRTARLPFIQQIVPGRSDVIAQADDWLTVQLQLETVDLAKMLLFGLGEDARIIQPAALRHAVLESADAMRVHREVIT